MKKAALIAAFLASQIQVWYWGFSEGWRQASEAAVAASTAPSEGAVVPVPLPAWRIPDTHSARS